MASIPQQTLTPDFNLTSMMLGADMVPSTVEIMPSGSNSYSKGGVIDLVIDSNTSFLDGQNSCLQFDLRLIGGGKLQGRVIDVIDFVEYSIGSERITDRRVGLIDELLHRTSISEDYQKSVSAMEELDYHHVNKSNLATAQTFILHFDHSILACKKQIPLQVMEGGIKMRINLANNMTDFCVGTVTEMEVTNVKFIAEFLTPSSAITDAYIKKRDSGGGIMMPFSQYPSEIKAVSSALTTLNEQVVPDTKGLKGVFFLMRNQTATTTNYKAHNWRPAGLTELQWKLGSLSYPQHAVRCSATAGYAVPYSRLRKAMNQYASIDNGSMIGMKNYVKNQDVPCGRRVTLLAGEATQTMTMTMASTTGLARGQYIYCSGFAGTEAAKINELTLPIATVPAGVTDEDGVTTYTITVYVPVPLASAAGAITGLTATITPLESTDGYITKPGSFVTGEFLEPIIHHTVDDTVLPTENRGQLRIEATFDNVAPNNFDKECVIIMHRKRVLHIGAGGQTTLI